MASFPVHPVTLRPMGQATLVANATIPAGKRGMTPTAGAPITVFAPAAIADGDAFTVEDSDGNAAANPITVNGNGLNIDGAATVVLSVNSVVATFVRDGAQLRRVNTLRAFPTSQIDTSGRIESAFLLGFDSSALPASAVTPPGVDKQVIFNDNGALGANAGLTFAKATGLASATAAMLGSGAAPATGNLRFGQVGVASQVVWNDGTTDRQVLQTSVGGQFMRFGTGGGVYSAELAGLECHLITGNGNSGVAVSNSGTQLGATGTYAFGGGVGVIGITTATTLPTTNPVGGSVLYADAGATKVRGSAGTVTTVAPA